MLLFVASQCLPALLAPEPLSALLGSSVRCALIVSLILGGLALGGGERLKPMLIGVGAVLLTAVVFSSTALSDLLSIRLTHPYMTQTTVGFAGGIGLLLALFTGLKAGIRYPLALLFAGALLMSGSRSALLGVGVGLLLALVRHQQPRRMAAGLLTVVLAVSALYISGSNVLQRYASIDLTGRDLIWSNTLSVIRHHPLGGVGSYGLGRYLEKPGACEFFAGSSGQGAECPAVVARVHSPWLIAHNISLQALVETGPLGWLGLAALLSLIFVTALWKGTPLELSLLTFLLAANVADNTLIVPSPFFAEVFWLVGGVTLGRGLVWNRSAGLVSGLLVLLLSLPLWSPLVTRGGTPGGPGTMRVLYAPPTFQTGQPYQVYAGLQLPPGSYRAALVACSPTCRTVWLAPYQASAGPVMISTRLPQDTSLLRLSIYPARSSLATTALWASEWPVEAK